MVRVSGTKHHGTTPEAEQRLPNGKVDMTVEAIRDYDRRRGSTRWCYVSN